MKRYVYSYTIAGGNIPTGITLVILPKHITDTTQFIRKTQSNVVDKGTKYS